MNVTALRLGLLDRGYVPLPITSPDAPSKDAGKAPRLPKWQTIEITPDAIRGWERTRRRETNTGLRCGYLLGLDIDVRDGALVNTLMALASDTIGATPLMRIGQAPKALLAYRTELPFTKIKTPRLLMPDGQHALIECLAAGQQFVGFVGVLSRAITRARRAAKADAKAKAEAEAKTAKAEAKAREAKAKADEKARKTAEAKARLDAQKTPEPLTDDDDDPLRDWTSPSPNTLPEIIVAPGERPAIADAALAAMAAAGVPFYQRDKDLVRVCLIKLKLSDGKTVRIPATSIVTRPMLMRALGLCATWHTYNKELDLVRIDPPTDLGDHILGMIGEWPFPPLRGVIATQTMRYDGSLLTNPGYDRATGLVLFNPPPMPPIPDQPTKNDALEALALLRNLVDEVDFADDDNVSLSGGISMLMTPVLRGMMAVAPMHVVNKPTAGTGGSYMQDLAAAIALGERCPVLSMTLRNDEENEKRLASAALTGQPIIAIDNMTGTLMGDFLCQLIERPMPQVRRLGHSEVVTIANNHCVMSNGNNVTTGSDAVRRTVQINLDANVENPEGRTFSHNPVAEVLADRGRYIGAILTIARAYRVAGLPGKLPPRLSFEDWSDNVRSPLVWLGWPDPNEQTGMENGK